MWLWQLMFKLKSKGDLFGINEEASTHSTPVFEKNLDEGIMGEANRDGTIFVKKGMSQDKINDAVEHENVHLKQMGQGRLGYTNNVITWKRDTKSPVKVFKRENMLEGAHNLPWEQEAYKKTK